jgi:phytanoyl-CoA hydroxylase
MSAGLTPTQVDAYQRDGFLVTPNVFSRAELSEMDAEFDRLLAVEAASSDSRRQPGGGWLLRLGLLSAKTAAWCEDERVLDLIAPLVQPGIAIYSAKLVSKEPRAPEVCHWHQDDAYYVSHSQSACRMSIWAPLQDVERDHGCLRVIPGSHRRGLQPTERKPDGTCDLSIGTEFDVGAAVDVPVSADSMVLFSALLYHASNGNATDERRRAFIVSYQEGTVGRGNGEQYRLLRSP